MKQHVFQRLLTRAKGRATRATFIAAGVLEVLSAVSFFAADARTAAFLTQADWDITIKSGFAAAFKLLGNSWLQIWLLLVWSYLSRKPKLFVTAVTALLLVAVVVGTTKTLTSRPRPREALHTATAQTATDTSAVGIRRSFPSGDTASVFACAAVGAGFAPAAWGVLFFGAAGAIGVLRVTSLAHYPSDVLAGAAVGLVMAWAAGLIVEALGWDWREMRERKWRLVPLIAILIVTALPGLIEKEHYVLGFLRYFWWLLVLLIFIYRWNLKFLLWREPNRHE